MSQFSEHNRRNKQNKKYGMPDWNRFTLVTLQKWEWALKSEIVDICFVLATILRFEANQ